MSKTVDNIIAYRIISMLVKPFKDTDAFKEGIIDERGKILKKANKLTTTKEKNAYTFLHRLIFKLKQFVEKAPGGKTRLGSLAAAYYLIREAYEGQESVHILREKYEDLISKDILEPLSDDLNTPLAISNLSKIKCSKTLKKSANLLGLLNRTPKEWFALNNKSTISKNDIELLIKERDEARKSKNFVKADEIRDQLDNNNVVLEDIDGKTIWRVKK